MISFTTVCVSIILLGFLFVDVNAIPCQCSCCSGMNCNPTVVGKFGVFMCSGCTTEACIGNYNSSCPQPGVAGTISADCQEPPACFHRDTIIGYKGKNYSFAEISTFQECYIPHIVRTSGYDIHSKCGQQMKHVRLTGDHLVHTKNGLKAAKDLKPSFDVIFGDISEKTECDIVSLEESLEVQDYFGLNCFESEVLANGIKASTFEITHSLPALWMNYFGGMFGIKSASVIGDFFIRVLANLRLV